MHSVVIPLSVQKLLVWNLWICGACLGKNGDYKSKRQPVSACQSQTSLHISLCNWFYYTSCAFFVRGLHTESETEPQHLNYNKHLLNKHIMLLSWHVTTTSTSSMQRLGGLFQGFDKYYFIFNTVAACMLLWSRERRSILSKSWHEHNNWIMYAGALFYECKIQHNAASDIRHEDLI